MGQRCHVSHGSGGYHPPLACLLLVLELLLVHLDAWGYRPFVSTDAAVTDPKEFEIELGYFTLQQTNGEDTFKIPSLVLNYGLWRGTEVVGEFQVEKGSSDDVQLVDPGLFLKAVLKEGILQEKDGISVAVEAGPLLPSTVHGERKFGIEGIGILSGRLAPFTYHVNLGGAAQRKDSEPVAIWGVIGELPILPQLRFVGEVNGEKARKESPHHSVLVGFIWRPSPSNIFLDAGIRRGIQGLPEWEFTLGLTFGFSLSAFISNVTSTSRGHL